jgi:hypothetical protein
MLIESFMAYSLPPSPAPTKAEVGEPGLRAGGVNVQELEELFLEVPESQQALLGYAKDAKMQDGLQFSAFPPPPPPLAHSSPVRRASQYNARANQSQYS